MKIQNHQIMDFQVDHGLEIQNDDHDQLPSIIIFQYEHDQIINFDKLYQLSSNIISILESHPL